MLQAQTRLADAEEHFEQATALDPEFLDGWLWLGSCKLALGNAVGAETCARRAIDLDANSGRAWLNLAMALTGQGRKAAGLQACKRAAALERETGLETGATAQLGALHYSQGRIADAIDLFSHTLPQRPDVACSSTFALALLTSGDYKAGWQQYEFRWFQEPMHAVRAKYSQPIWSGQSLQGKTILLRAEQGFGDIIQFARFATPLKGLGAHVLMQVHRGFEGLAASFADVDRVFAEGEEFTAFDFYCNMMSLPAAFGTELETIPAHVPYLDVDPRQRELWRSRLPVASGARVGIAWAGNPKHLRDLERSIPLERLAPLLGIDGIRVVSLQKDLRPGDREHLAAFSSITDLGTGFGNFVDTAAVIDQLDLVICVDTAIAHLAGALGKPVWLLITDPCDFRWLRNRDDSPWYPTMRLFRQENAGEWAPVVARVADELNKAIATGSFATPPPPPTATAGSPTSSVDMPDRSATDCTKPRARSVYFSKFMSQLPRPIKAPVKAGSHQATPLRPYVGAIPASLKTRPG